MRGSPFPLGSTGGARKSGHFICSRERTDHVLPTPGHVPVDGGGVPPYDAAQLGGRGRRARRLLMCAVASAPGGSLRRERPSVGDYVAATATRGGATAAVGPFMLPTLLSLT